MPFTAERVWRAIRDAEALPESCASRRRPTLRLDRVAVRARSSATATTACPTRRAGCSPARSAATVEPTGDVDAGVPVPQRRRVGPHLHGRRHATCCAPMRDAEAHGDEIVGVWHSHTHTDAYPSPTDVRQAVDPAWLYVIVCLRHGEPDAARRTASATARSPRSPSRSRDRLSSSIHRRMGARIRPVRMPDAWPSRSSCPPSCAPTPTARRRSRPTARPSARCSTTSSRRYPGLAGNLSTTTGALHKFVNVYTNDDDIRYLEQLDTKVADGDVDLDPARGRRRLTPARRDATTTILGLIGNTPLVGVHAAVAEPRRPRSAPSSRARTRAARRRTASR